LTGIYLSSNAGGQAAAELRRAGFYALMIRGKASSPIYLFIKDQDIEFRPATHLWGMKTIEAQQRIAEEIGNPRVSIMVIGPAGEKLVKIACVLTEGDKKRTFSRGGSGAVFGSKNLKGVAILGTSSAEIQDLKSLQKTQREIGAILRANRDWVRNRRLYGTGGNLHLLNEMNLLPTHNWQKGSFPGANQIGPFFVRRKWTTKDISCGPFCPAPCGKVSFVPSGEFAGATSGGPEYETLYALGSNCGVDRFDAIIHAEQLCDELGLDTISTGGTLSFAMECFERGIIGKKDTGGIMLNFGHVEAMMQFIKKIAYREGFGDLLAEGTKRASQKIGGGSEAWAIQAKGLELGGFDCRGLFGQALQYALGSRGGCHHDLGIPGLTEIKTGKGKELQGKGQLLKDTLSERIVYDSAILCSFSSRILEMELLAKMLTAISGWEIKEKDLLLIAERIFTLERAFNIREGISRKEDRLPERLSREVPLDLLLDDFYEVAGWDKNSGIPLPGTLERLGLDLNLEKFVHPYSR